MSSLNRTAFALSACETLLRENRLHAGRTMNTTTLLKLTGTATEKRQYTLKVMHGLCKRGVCGKIGVGKFKWFLINTNFNKSNPFNTTTGEQPATASLPSAETYYITGNTYPVKEELEVIGCRWNGVHECWTIDNFDGAEKARQLSTSISVSPVPPNGVAPATPPSTPAPFGVTDNEMLEMVVEIGKLKQKVIKLEEKQERAAKVFKIEKPNGETVILTDEILPKVFKKVLDLAKMRKNILLVGPAGCGKTHLGELIAKSLGLSFGAISCTAGMTEIQLLGRSVPDLTTGKSRFEGTEFLRCYEEGGVFLLDEIDAIDANVLLVLNTALANGYMMVPNRSKAPRAKKHPDFVCIASANTYGRGANRQYVGRAQLDSASLDRFAIGTIEMYYDDLIEEMLCPNINLRNTLQNIRRQIETSGLRRIMSTRFLRDSYEMMEGCDWSISEIVQTYLQGWTPEEIAKLGNATTPVAG